MGGIPTPNVTESQIAWIKKQKLFWIATATTDKSVHVNVSPRGLSDATALKISDDGKKIWWVDLTGSGVETIAHLRHSPRITLLFMELGSGAPLILRIYGTATHHEPTSPHFAHYAPPPDSRSPGTRAILVMDVEACKTSCGFTIPIFDFVKDRPALIDWATKMESIDQVADAEAGVENAIVKGKVQGKLGIKKYRANKNSQSFDGLMGLESAFVDAGKAKGVGYWLWRVKSAVGARAEGAAGFMLGVGIGFSALLVFQRRFV